MHTHTHIHICIYLHIYIHTYTCTYSYTNMQVVTNPPPLRYILLFIVIFIDGLSEKV